VIPAWESAWPRLARDYLLSSTANLSTLSANLINAHKHVTIDG